MVSVYAVRREVSSVGYVIFLVMIASGMSTSTSSVVVTRAVRILPMTVIVPPLFDVPTAYGIGAAGSSAIFEFGLRCRCRDESRAAQRTALPSYQNSTSSCL